MIHEAAAYEQLIQTIHTRRKAGHQAIEQVFRHPPEDYLVRPGQMVLLSAGSELELCMFERPEASALTDYALRQLAERFGLPASWIVKNARSPEEWRRSMASDVVNRELHNSDGKPLLVRIVAGRVSAVLSDRFRRLDSRPILESLIGACDAVDGALFDGVVTETRVAIRWVVLRLVSPAPGEWICPGFEWSNSDVGDGRHLLRPFVYRVEGDLDVSLSDSLSEVHVGHPIPLDVEQADKLIRSETKKRVKEFSVAAIDMMAEDAVEALRLRVEAATKCRRWKQARQVVLKHLRKSELEKAEAYFQDEDVILPKGKTLWRFGLAVRMVGESTSKNRELELRRLAGVIIEVPAAAKHRKEEQDGNEE